MAAWRCSCCFGTPLLCTDCCRITHRHHPFHHIESWTGEYFSESWLWKAGTILHLGHNGGPCPGERWDASDATLMDSLNQLSLPEDNAERNDLAWKQFLENPIFHDEDYDEVADEDGGGLYNESEIPNPPISTIDSNRVLTYVHVNGVHQLPTSFCKCQGAASKEIQLLRWACFHRLLLLLKQCSLSLGKSGVQNIGAALFFRTPPNVVQGFPTACKGTCSIHRPDLFVKSISGPISGVVACQLTMESYQRI